MRILLTAAVAILEAGLLGWQQLHGGVPAHHVLARADLPAISNGWGLLTLPLLAWWLLGRIERRRRQVPAYLGKSLAPLVGAFAFGVVLGGCAVTGHLDVCNGMVMALAPVALFYPIHRAECLLGFVLGMNLFIGAMLPTVAGLVFATIGAVLYHGVRFLWLVTGARADRHP